MHRNEGRFVIHPLLILAYLGLSALVAVVGRRRRRGYWGTMLFSILLTPLIMIFFLFAIMPKQQPSPAASPHKKQPST